MFNTEQDAFLSFFSYINIQLSTPTLGLLLEREENHKLPFLVFFR